MDSTWSEEEMRVYERNASAHRIGLTPDEVAVYYSKWSENYEQVNIDLEYSLTNYVSCRPRRIVQDQIACPFSLVVICFAFI